MHHPLEFPQGEKHLSIDGPAGIIEAITCSVEAPIGIGIVCHPHPLQEGTMHNKVVHIVSRAFNNKGLATIRFNYRGVGKSQGSFGDSIGEVEDLLAVIAWANLVMPNTKIWLAGFSFGAYIAALAATLYPCVQLFSVAPAVHHQPYDDLPALECPWVVIQGQQDEVVAPEDVYTWFNKQKAKMQFPMSLLKLEASHFFHGKLVTLRDLVEENFVTHL